MAGWRTKEGGPALRGYMFIYFDNLKDDPMAVQDNDSAWFECTEIRGI